MCRVAIFNKQGLNLIEEKYGIEKFLLRLEKECGGQGNGIALTNHGKLFYLKKGLDYSVVQIAKQLKTMSWEWCAFHTRVKSVGEVTDKNCHPFKSGDIVLAMNGTEQGYSGLANALKITDTQAVLLSITKFRLPLLDTLSPLSSNFIGFDNGVPFATSPNGWKSYAITKDDKGAIVIASSLPDEFTIYEPIDKPFVWTGNGELKVKEKKQYVYIGSSVHNYGSSKNNTNIGEKSVSTVKNTKTYDSWWNRIYGNVDMTIYNCPTCKERSRGYELIEDMGELYCPYCGTTLKKVN